MSGLVIPFVILIFLLGLGVYFLLVSLILIGRGFGGWNASGRARRVELGSTRTASRRG